MLNPTYQSILNLLIAYEQQLTLSKDEFDAVDFYLQAGYHLAKSQVYSELELVILEPPPNTVASVTDERDSEHLVTYYLVKDGE